MAGTGNRGTKNDGYTDIKRMMTDIKRMMTDIKRMMTDDIKLMMRERGPSPFKRYFITVYTIWFILPVYTTPSLLIKKASHSQR